MSGDPIKISAYLRKVGDVISPYFSFDSKNIASIDVCNFVKLNQGNPNAVFEFDQKGFFGSGYIKISEKVENYENNYPVLFYPVKTAEPGIYNIYVRLFSINSSIKFNLYLDDELVSSLDVSGISTSDWDLVKLELVFPDSNEHSFGIQIEQENVLLDSIIISKEEYISEEIVYDKNYCTIHAKVYELDSNNNVISTSNVYDYKNTINDIFQDDWYFFSTKPLDGYSSLDIEGRYSFVLFLSGSSSSHYILWDYSNEDVDPYLDKCSFYYDYNQGEWVLDCNRAFSIKVYTYSDSLDVENCKIITPSAEQFTNIIDVFNDEDKDPVFLNTKVVDNGDDSNRVELSLPDKIVNFVIDQSGSQTWNDTYGIRHEVSQRMLNRINSVYPGNLKYNIYTAGSSPINLNFYGMVEDSETNISDINDIAKSFANNQESSFSGIRLVRSLNDYPSGPLDGETVYDGFSTSAIDVDLLEGTEYFYTIYTYDNNNKFSNGKNIKAIPNQRILPFGVSYFDYNILKGSGIRRDDDCVALWHFDEGTGSFAYDFSDSQFHVQTNDKDIFWLNSKDVPFGKSGVRLDGARYFTFNDSENKISNEKITFMGWVYPLSDSAFQGILSIGDLYQNGLYIGIDSDAVFLTKDFSEFIYYPGLTFDEWNHIAVTIDNTLPEPVVSIYINGTFIGSDVFSSSIERNSVRVDIGNISFYSNPSYKLFAKIKDFAIFNSIKDLSYIYDSYNNVQKHSDLNDFDNGDRIVLLNYSIPDDFNYVNGIVRIIMKEDVGSWHEERIIGSDGNSSSYIERYGEFPYHENDGSVVYEGEAESGNFTISIPIDFVLERKYFFKIMSKNSSDVWCHYKDAPVLEVKIPSMKYPYFYVGEPELPIETISNVQSISGVGKNYIYWDEIKDQRVRQVKIWFSEESYPIFENGSADGDLVFIGNKEDNKFVHRNISNNIKYYYTIVSMDQYGFSGEPAFAESIPSLQSDESSIPLQEVTGLKYEIIDYSSLRILWDIPIAKYQDIYAWFDQRIIFYCQIIDSDGDYIEDLDRIQLKISDIQSNFSGLSEDVFGDIINRDIIKPNPEDLYLISYENIGDGIIKGTLRLFSDSYTLSSINSLKFNVSVYTSVPDRNNSSINVFEFYSEPISVTFKNPWYVKLINKNEDYIDHLCKKEVPLSDLEFLSSLEFDPNFYRNFNGCFIRRDQPFVVQVVASYKDEPLFVGNSCLVSIHDASNPSCEQDWEPDFADEESQRVLPESSIVDFYNITTEEESSAKTISAADIYIKSPRYPQGAMLFVKTSYNGYISRQKMYIVFENILRVEVTTNAPEPNCIERAEQFCSAYVIDPNNSTIKKYIPDMQICKWNIRKSITGKDRPFYSTDSVPNGPGIFSYFRNGSANDVYFGPACGVVPQIINDDKLGILILPEIYAIRASVVYDGLSSFEEMPLIVWPKTMSNNLGSRFLVEGPSIVSTVWADGYDYVKMIISHNSNTSSTPFASCFRDCASRDGSSLAVLNQGQIVNINAGDMEILYGEDLSISYDSENGYDVFTDASESLFRAEIPLSYNSDYTDFYVKINKFIGKEKPLENDSFDSVKGSNTCECLNINQNEKESENDIIINGDTLILVDQQERYLKSGGNLKDGIPPVIVRPVEPLYISFVDQRINGIPTNQIVVDGITEHEFFIEVSFAGKPVPIGTPVYLSFNTTIIDGISISPDSVVYTYNDNDKYLNPTGDVKSYCKFTISPLNPSSSFEIQITAKTTYDKRGDINREMLSCISIQYSTDQPYNNEDSDNVSQKNIDNIFSKSLERYDVFVDEWNSLKDMTYPRGGLSLDWNADAYGEFLFAIGGIDGNKILSYNERYNILDDKWESMSKCKTPRCYHVSCSYGNYIYIFGGLIVEDNILKITNSVEKYDVINDEWEYVSSMPSIGSINESSYGVTLGSISVIGNKAYILCGIRELDSSATIKYLNDKILIYDFIQDSWSYNDIDENYIYEYMRVSPVSYVDNDGYIRILGGVVENKEDTSNVHLEYFTSSLMIDVNDYSISLDDSKYDNMPKPFYKSSSTLIDGISYIAGGITNVSGSSNILNIINTDVVSADPFECSAGSVMLKGKNAFGFTNDNNQYLYSAGGITSGRPEGFLQIKAASSKNFVRLDGQESVTIDMLIRDEYGNYPEEVSAFIRGYLVFDIVSSSDFSGGDSSQKSSSDAVNRNDLVYPVSFSSNDVLIRNGSGSFVLMPRSEDILKNIKDIKEKLGIQGYLDGEQNDSLIINQGDIRFPYKIRVQISIIDDFYYGETVINVSDNNDQTSNSSNSNSGSNSDSDSDPYSGGSSSGSSLDNFSEDCISIQTSKQSGSSGGGSNSNSNDISDLSIKNDIFSFVPSQFSQLASPIVGYYSDIDWIPQTKRILTGNSGSYDDALSALRKIQSRIPFGASPIYDALYKVSEDLLDESANDFSKVIYLHTDNEENLSIYDIDSVIDNIQSIDGYFKVPVIINNYSIVFPLTLSAMSNRTDTDNLENISYSTGGQSQTIISSSFIDDNINNSIGKMAGSLGYGLFEYTIDLGQSCIVSNISTDYTLYDNTTGNWKVSISEDNFNYSDYSRFFDANTEVDFEDFSGRYLKFRMTLLSGLSAYIDEAYEDIPTPGSPSINAINITYDIPKTSYLYLNKETMNYSAQQVIASVNANNNSNSEISVGISTGNSFNWNDYYSGSQPAIEQSGKIFIPIRTNYEDVDINEPLEKITDFAFRAKYGRWHDSSNVVIRDSEGNIFDNNYYKVYPRLGVVVFAEKQMNSLFIDIENEGKIRLGLKITNKKHDESAEISGLGFMYNTNVFLPPPVSEKAPYVTNLNISPSKPYIYSSISIEYVYNDINMDKESESIISWYINGIEIEYLRNLRSWNDINNTEDPLWRYGLQFSSQDVPSGMSYEEYARQLEQSILKVGDIVYCVVQPFDGKKYGQKTRSSSVAVVESPPFITNIAVKSMNDIGIVSDSITTGNVVFASYNFFADDKNNKSIIIWYVNGSEFKKGYLGEYTGDYNNEQISPGESNNNVFALQIGNTIQVEIIPSTSITSGDPVKSETKTVENQPPEVSEVIISPSKPKTSSNLVLTYKFNDVDVASGSSSQSNQSSLRWYRKKDGETEFSEVTELRNQSIILSKYLSIKDIWKAEVVPFDGLSVGETVESDIVTIT